MRRNVNRKNYNDWGKRDNINITNGYYPQVSGCLLQTAQTWAYTGVCSASCAHSLGIMFEPIVGPSWKARQAMTKARSTSILRAALKRDEEEENKRLADEKLREEHVREERLLQEMLRENREFIEDYLEKAVEKQQPKVAAPPEGDDAPPPEAGDVTSGTATNQNAFKKDAQKTGLPPIVPVQKEKTFVTEIAPPVGEATVGDVKKEPEPEPEPVYDEKNDSCYFPPLSRQTSLVKPVYTDWETSDKSLNYLERRLQLFNPTSGKRKTPVSLPKLKRFEAKVWTQVIRACKNRNYRSNPY